jgi:hypothetical protein
MILFNVTPHESMLTWINRRGHAFYNVQLSEMENASHLH